MIDNVTSIDFETACRDHASACAVGMVKIRDNKVVDEFYSLIKPPAGMNVIDEFYDIHGISDEDVADAPDFSQIWPKMKEFIGDDILCAHNSSFDSDVLQSCLSHYSIAEDKFDFICTVQTARKHWPRPILPCHRLNVVCDFLGIELDHHNALSDALACAKILIAADCGLKGK